MLVIKISGWWNAGCVRSLAVFGCTLHERGKHELFPSEVALIQLYGTA